MSVPQAGGGPIAGRDDLVQFLSSGSKPKDTWRIGTEHEKFGFRLATHQPVPYEGPDGIRAMLQGMTRFGWEPVLEGETLIGLTRDKGAISLEPGGQFELSGAPLENIHQTCTEVNRHLAEVREVGDELGIGFLGLGFSPKWTRAETPVMPKGRYKIMSSYMPKRGNLGLDMMFRTCTVQTNLDFSSEADMVKKFRVSLALQPVATALFAASPFTEGKPNGFQSFRARIWTDTDPDRTGNLPFVFEDGFSFERYVDYALDVPMYFVYRNGKYTDATSVTFRQFLDGKFADMPGETPLMDDWANHLTTLFPEVRIKKYMEMRGADGGPWQRLCALPALWVGLLYDQSALDAAWDLVKDWTQAERDQLSRDVPRMGLKAPFRKGTVHDLARRVLEIAAAGLKARNALSFTGENEVHFLDSLRDVVASGKTPADVMLERFHGPWQGSIDPVFTELAY